MNRFIGLILLLIGGIACALNLAPRVVPADSPDIRLARVDSWGRQTDDTQGFGTSTGQPPRRESSPSRSTAPASSGSTPAHTSPPFGTNTGSRLGGTMHRFQVDSLPTVRHLPDQTTLVYIDLADPVTGAAPLSGSEYSARPELSRVLPFYIDQFEITVEQFKKFDPGYDETRFTNGKPCPKCPAMGINWMNASRYCIAMKKRLPTEAEWMVAARGKSTYPWPWGYNMRDQRANLLGEEDGFLLSAPVGSFPLGASPFGVMDMTGNVWEWVSTPYTPEPGQGLSNLRIAKGGGWTSPQNVSQVNFRNIVDPGLENPTFGFRCAKSKH